MWYPRLNVTLTAIHGLLKLLTNPQWLDAQRQALREMKVLAA